ncbi:sn-glycerol-3-phosphate ABC transporter ATP-binding protein UgpC [Mesorhizobium sp. Z1-4]|uniref:ABC transporter ATP-binding protein n=1 Tax=Mesorhizobium sp. Z1-4 TaxID=2448478 RepID=UPI000FDC6223|nr:sn-glycerol-3-phosphate ABC transporter ATP-binding protein UgpC [Mesorhizobium sp. Z1-4]
MALLQARHFCKDFGAVNVIPDLSIDIQEGDFTVLVGPSGCGKSTLLRMIAGLEDITRGELLIDGRLANDLHPRERGISMVFQSYALYPHMSVSENIGFGLKLEGCSKAEIKQRVGDVADALQLGELLHRRPAQLSGGQRQRVAIGRAIVRKPRIILFDEPLSNLDAKLRVEMRMELMKFHSNHGITTIYVTHDQVEAMTMASRIAVMEKGQIRQFDTPKKLFDAPTDPFVAGFIGSPQMNLFEVSKVDGKTLVTKEGATISFAGLSSDRIGHAATIGVRPEHVSIGGKEGELAFMARVDLIENLGDESIVHLVSGTQKITARAFYGAECRVDQEVRLGFREANTHMFDQAGQRLA